MKPQLDIFPPKACSLGGESHEGGSYFRRARGRWLLNSLLSFFRTSKHAILNPPPSVAKCIFVISESEQATLVPKSPLWGVLMGERGASPWRKAGIIYIEQSFPPRKHRFIWDQFRADPSISSNFNPGGGGYQAATPNL